jgi:hypothetical protein
MPDGTAAKIANAQSATLLRSRARIGASSPVGDLQRPEKKAAEGIRTLNLLHGKQSVGLSWARKMPANERLPKG